MKVILLSVLLTVFSFSAGALNLAAEELVGLIKTAVETVVMRDGDPMAALPGMELQQGDIVKTGAAGSAGLILSDDTVISMGPQTELAVESYLFEPVEGQFSCILELVRGTISYLTGQIAKLAPESVELMTPAATIGVRGTQVLIRVD